jgi:hypothetical protein
MQTSTPFSVSKKHQKSPSPSSRGWEISPKSQVLSLKTQEVKNSRPPGSSAQRYFSTFTPPNSVLAGNFIHAPDGLASDRFVSHCLRPASPHPGSGDISPEVTRCLGFASGVGVMLPHTRVTAIEKVATPSPTKTPIKRGTRLFF